MATTGPMQSAAAAGALRNDVLPAAAADPNDPWAFQREHEKHNPLFAWKAGYQPIDQYTLSGIKPALVKAGLWKPEYDAYAANPGAYAPQGGTVVEGELMGARPGLEMDLSELNGYSIGAARSSGANQLRAVVGPDGRPLDGWGEVTDGNTSLRSEDYRDMAIAAAAMVAGGYGIGTMAGTVGAGAVGGAGAGTAAGGAAGTAGSSSVMNAALAESAIGTAGYGASSAGAGGGALASWGSGAGYAADAAGSSGGGLWDAIKEYGSSALGGGGTNKAGGMDWIQLANLGAGLYASNKAGDRAEDATALASQAAAGNLQLSRDAFEWYKNFVDSQAPQRAAAEKRAQDVSDAQLQGMQFATQQAKELDAYNKSTFRPVEQRIVSEAQAYDTPERRAAAAATAAADVDMSAAATRAGNDRALARSGIAPGSMKAQALAADASIGQSAARGSAMTGAARNVEQQGYARMIDAASLGRNLPATQATQQQIANTTGNSAVQNSLATLQPGQTAASQMQTGFNTAINANSAAGNLFNGIAGNANQQDQILANSIGQIGKWAGSTYGSDKNIKKGTGKMADAAKALKQVEKTPVHEGWQYDPAKGGPDDGGQTHTGPMAQDVRKNMGDKIAPDGKAIDIVSMNGKMMAAIQALAKDVRALKKAEADEKEQVAA